MNKKVVILLVAFLLLDIFLAVDVSSINESDISEIQEIIETNETVEIPESVRQALMDFISAKRIEKEKQESKRGLVENILLASTSAAFLIVLYLMLKQKGVLHSIRKKIRLHLMFQRIRKLRLRKLDFNQIKLELLNRKWKKKYVYDAIHRYKKRLEKRTPLEDYSPSSRFHKLRRRLRRRVLYRYIKKMSRKGMEKKQIIKELTKQGFKERHAYDAFYRYSKHFEKKKNIILNLISGLKTCCNPVKSIKILKRRVIRAFLYNFYIKKMLRKKMSKKEIEKALLKKGFKKTHVNEAVFEYVARWEME
jgi:predicted RNA binding protein YcfA (HicA-like mRNA interferase family)